MKKSDKVLILSLIFLAIIGVIIWHYWDKVDDGGDDGDTPQVAVVNNFDECASAGYVIGESYPRQCWTPDGRTFVEDIGNELEKTDLIRISTPRPNTTIQSPVKITGEARGYWFFEASFPIKIYDADGKELGMAIAEAKSEWMTEGFVPFEAMLAFDLPTTAKGTLVLQKDNPSGLPENEDKLVVPVVFGAGENSQAVSLYYYNPDKDQDASGNVQCSKQGLVPVSRNITSGDNAIRDTIKLLLEGGLTAEEKNGGVTTEYPIAGLSLKDANLRDGTLTLTFDDSEGRTVGGACRVGVLWSQIESTAKQFPEVKEVKFMPEELFQP
ncbi:MAG: Gmad2 immunoglobulin-like domain-containing protein [Candidatus Pacebacteria bacterium]|nr:Gmad2 immunoglobulin-like domain-containing protein [Candidatus Paceibacterota bacterium]